MESGTPGVQVHRRRLDEPSPAGAPDPQATPFRGVALTPTLPRSLAGPASAVAMDNIRSSACVPGENRGAASSRCTTACARTSSTARAARRSRPSRSCKGADPSSTRPPPAPSIRAGATATACKQIAQLIKADVGLEVAFTEIGGWDHHAAEGGVQGQLAGRLREFGQALVAFHRDLGDRMRDVVVVSLTEFGRTARENGNRGTDHGHASVSFVMGGEVRGGRVHGRWPGLRAGDLYEGRDLAVTTDFRDVLAEVLTAHLGARNVGRVFPGHAANAAPSPA